MFILTGLQQAKVEVKVTEGASTKDEKKATKRLIDSMND
jgi:hypothetical protein